MLMSSYTLRFGRYANTFVAKLRAGVADGVGGWHSHGVEPSHFSSDLMASCSKMAYLRRGHLESPKEILKWGFEELLWVHHKSYGESCMRLSLIYSTKKAKENA